MPFFLYVPPLLRRSSVYVSRSPKGLQDVIKFCGSTFDPGNEIVLETRDDGRAPGIPRTSEEESLFCLDDPLVRGNNAVAFFRERRIPGELPGALR